MTIHYDPKFNSTDLVRFRPDLGEGYEDVLGVNFRIIDITYQEELREYVYYLESSAGGLEVATEAELDWAAKS